MQPVVGHVIYYTLQATDGVKPFRVGEVRPAIITQVFANEYPNNPLCTYGVNLQVFLDGPNDVEAAGPTVWRASCEYSAQPQPGTWHWPGC